MAGILQERRPGKSLRKRVSTFAKNLKQRDFVKYAAGKVVQNAGRKLTGLAEAGLRFVHAGRPVYPAAESMNDVSQELGCRYLVTTDCHSQEALDFVRSLGADLGLVYGTRILKPCLFTIPSLGSINIHKRKVPDYRGGGPVGLWEMLDGQPEFGVTVHEVEEKLDAGAVINAATIAIEPFDDLTSMALKAHVVANDLLVKSVADYARGTVHRAPQHGESRMFKNPSPQQLAKYEEELARRRPGFRAARGRSSAKLLARSIVGTPVVAARNWIRRSRGRFPVMILFHHLVADRSHALGMSTTHFLRHVEFLRKFYQIVSLSEAIEMLRTNNVKAPTVVLTVDDGYRDNFLTLRAIRERIDLPITMFVSTAMLNSQGRFPHDVRHGNTGFETLTWDQVAQLQREGFEIGSHTRTHFDCGSTNVAALRDEIAGSKQDLERHLGRPVDQFSFPFGLPKNISPEAMKLAGENYTYVSSAYGGSNFAPADGVVRHLRRWAHPNDLWELELMLQGALEFEPVKSDAAVPALSSEPQAFRAAS